MENKTLRLLVSFLWSCFPAFLFYLLVLQPGLFSRVRMGLAICLIPLLGLVLYKLLPRIKSFQAWTWVWIAMISTLAALLGRQALLLYPQKIFFFEGRHQLELQVTSLTEGQTFALTGFQTSLGDVSFNTLGGLSDWTRAKNELTPLSVASGPLTWSGWVGDQAVIYLRGSPGVVAQIIWDGGVRNVGFGPAAPPTLSIQTNFSIPAWGSLLLFSTLGLAIAFVLTLFFAAWSNLADTETAIHIPSWLVAGFLITTFLLLTTWLLRIFLAIDPNNMFPGRDSGVFLYIARHLLEGQIPYRDIWDHKGPLIYWIDALGMVLGKGSLWGVWSLEIFWALAGLVVLYVVMSRIAGRLPALIGGVIYLAGFEGSLSGGNYSEEYGLLFQILTIFLVWSYFHRRDWKELFLAGLCVSFLFLLRPNQISVGLGLGLILILLALKNRLAWTSLQPLLSLAIGFLIPAILFAAYFAVNHAFAEMLSAVFIFNRIYVGPLQWDWLGAFQLGLYSFPWIGFWVVLGAIGCLVQLVTRTRAEEDFWFWLFIGLSFAAEVFLSGLSQAGFRHYYLMWLPYIALTSALAIRWILWVISGYFHAWQKQILFGFLGLAILASISYTVRMDRSLWSLYSSPSRRDGKAVWDTPKQPVNEVKNYLGAHSTLLFWGAQTSINYMTGVDAPTRFVYLYPLMYPDYAAPDLVRQFTLQVSASLPVIVDASAGDAGIIPLEQGLRVQVLQTPEGQAQYGQLLPFFEFFDAHYHLVGRLSYNNWPVYAPDQ